MPPSVVAAALGVRGDGMEAIDWRFGAERY